MSENSSANMFFGHKSVGNLDSNSTTIIRTGNGSNPSNSEAMTANTNTKSETTTSPGQSSFNGTKTGTAVASLASATEPPAMNFSFNQSQPSVATFPQTKTGGSPTAQGNSTSPFGASFGQSPPSAPNQPFGFGSPTSSTSPARFSLSNLPSKTSPGAQATTPQNAPVFTKRSSDPPTPVYEQPSAANREQEDTDVPADMAQTSLLAKRVNNTLRDPKALVVDRNDPNSPLYAMTSFEELNLKPNLLKGIYNMAFQTPSKIQSIALPRLLDNPPKNIIAQSQSGTGKTASFSLAILSRIDPAIQSPQALILAPTFELAIQIGSVIEKMAHFLPHIQIAYAVRDPNYSKRHDRPRNQPIPESIVIGTPGTVEDWCLKLRMIDLSRLRMCCVDEADVMIATQGFRENCMKLVGGLNRPQCQMMLFSATYSDEVMNFAKEIVPDPMVLRLKREKQALTNIKQYFIQCYNDEHKYNAVEQIYTSLTVGQAMIFCRTKATARKLAIRMASQQHAVRELTAALDIEQRASIIHQFREGLFRVLISTNVTSRGLDIDDVSLVINYDMPMTMTFEPDCETYLHRIGRCGRFGKQGYTFNLIGSEKDFNIMKQIEEYFTHPIDEITTDGISQLEPEED